MDTTYNRRRNYFIDKKFQTSFIIKFCTLVIIGTAISGSIIYYMSRSTVTTTFENSRLLIKSTADFILPSVLLGGAIVIIIVGLATIVVTLLTSHKIAGPLYRMEKDLGEVMSGNLNMRFNLRKTDEIKALAERLDGMVQALRSDVSAVKEKADAIVSAVEKEPVNIGEVKANAAGLKKILEKFRT